MGQDLTVGGHPSTYDFTGNDPANETLVYPSSGQSLADVAKTLHVDAEALAKANPLILYPNQGLSPFQEIRVPNNLKPQMPVPYAAPPSAPQGTPTKAGATHEAGSVDAKSMADLQLRQATINGLIDKASAAGLGPKDLVIIAGIGALSNADFNKANSAIEAALKSSDPRAAMESLGPKIIQGSSEEWVAESTLAMANRTGHTPDSFRPGSLKGVEEASVVAHGNEMEVQIGNKWLSPGQLAEELKDAGWQGGTIRLVSCETGSPKGTFAQDLANELHGMGIDSTVIAPVDEVGTLSGDLGLPRVVDPAGGLRPPGEGWETYTAETGRSASEVAGGMVEGLTSGLMIDAAVQAITNYFGSFQQATAAIKSESYADGFAQGMAAALAGEPQSKYAIRGANPSTTDRQVGAEGTKEEFHNKGLADGYKFFQSLPPDQQQQVRSQLGAQGYNVKSSPGLDNVMKLEGALLPGVKDMFEKAQEAARQQEIERTKQDSMTYGPIFQR